MMTDKPFRRFLSLLLLLLMPLLLSILFGTTGASSTSPSWQWIPEEEHPCTVRVVLQNGRQRHQVFRNSGGRVPPLYPEPIVIRRDPKNDVNADFRRQTEKDNLLAWFGPDFPVTLSSSNSLSEHRRHTTLAQYIHETLTAFETTPEQRSNETWYLFGETYSDEWRRLLYPHYVLPPCVTCQHQQVALAMGIGNRGSGVQWHVHGPGFSEALHGRKHWLLYPPTPLITMHDTNDTTNNNTLLFSKDESSRQWMESVYPTVSPKPVECTLEPGDLIYFPNHWWHATVNLDPYTAFISTFTTEHNAVNANGKAKQQQLQRQQQDNENDDLLFLLTAGGDDEL